MKCEKCGGSFNNREGCADRYQRALANEFENPEYGIVHHLTVPCYHLQHNLYSKEGWIKVRQILHQFLNEGLTADKARNINRDIYDNGKRNYSITKGETFADVDKINWTFTIADIHFDTPEVYCNTIKTWAISILKDSAAICDNDNKHTAM